MAQTRVLLVDDHRTFSGALTALLSMRDDLEVVAAVPSASAARAAISSLSPDVVLIDVDLEGENGIDLVRELQEAGEGPGLVVLTCHDDPATAAEALNAGAVGFVAKDAPADELTAAIDGAARGEGWVNPRLLPDVVSQLTGYGSSRSADEERLESLTPRERQILTCLMSGLDRKEIAGRLELSPNTVRTHVRNILAKLDVHSSLEAVALGYRYGWKPPADAPPVRGVGPVSSSEL